KGFTHDESFSADGDPDDQWTAGRAGFRLDWHPPGPNAVTVEGEVWRSVAGRSDLRPGLTLAPTYVFTNREDEVSTGGNILVRLTHEVDRESNWSVQAYWDRFARRGTNGLFDFDINTFDLDFQ